MTSKRRLIPLIVFLLVCVLFYFMLDRDTQLLPSPLVGKAVPEFSLPALPLTIDTEVQSETNNHLTNITSLNNESFQGQKWILNIWASWCAACVVEHPFFNKISEDTDWLLVGLNYKDQQADAIQWLVRMKNPFEAIIFDPEGSLGLDLGVYGVPETFLIDEQGVIRYKHVGPICADIIEQVITPFFQNQTLNMNVSCQQ